MTGYQSKKAAALDKLEQWDTPSKAFNAWWDSDYDDSTNPYEKDTFAYWAWAGWQAALAQPAQEPVAWMWKDMGGTELVSLFKPRLNSAPLYTATPQRTWVDLTDDEISDIAINNPPAVHEFARAVLAKSKEKNNG